MHEGRSNLSDQRPQHPVCGYSSRRRYEAGILSNEQAIAEIIAYLPEMAADLRVRNYCLKQGSLYRGVHSFPDHQFGFPERS